MRSSTGNAFALFIRYTKTSFFYTIVWLMNYRWFWQELRGFCLAVDENKIDLFYRHESKALSESEPEWKVMKKRGKG